MASVFIRFEAWALFSLRSVYIIVHFLLLTCGMTKGYIVFLLSVLFVLLFFYATRFFKHPAATWSSTSYFFIALVNI